MALALDEIKAPFVVRAKVIAANCRIAAEEYAEVREPLIAASYEIRIDAGGELIVK